MPVKTFKATSPGKRFMTVEDFSELTKKAPEESLIKPLKKKSGRNHHGHVTVRHKGGGARRMYRIIDWKRTKDNVPARVFAIEYDPNRCARIALLHYADGTKTYILCPVGLKVGDTVISGEGADIKPANCLPLKNIPVGTLIHNVELQPAKGAQLARTAGAAAQLMAKEGSYAHIRLPSGEMRLVSINCRASIGQVGNTEHENVDIGKAGRSRHLGIRPAVRGVATNPCDHPHGGGEARSTPGRPSTTPWGKPTYGLKTRRKQASDRLIIRRRKK